MEGFHIILLITFGDSLANVFCDNHSMVLQAFMEFDFSCVVSFLYQPVVLWDVCG